MIFVDAPRTDHERRVDAEARRQAADIHEAYGDLYGEGDDSRARSLADLVNEAKFENERPLYTPDYMVVIRFYRNRYIVPPARHLWPFRVIEVYQHEQA